MEIGTVWAFSETLRAVTITVSNVPSDEEVCAQSGRGEATAKRPASRIVILRMSAPNFFVEAKIYAGLRQK